MWIQGERSGAQWVYDDGTEFTFSNWNTGEGWTGSPVVIIKKSEGYKWHDAEYGHAHFGVLCEIYF